MIHSDLLHTQQGTVASATGDNSVDSKFGVHSLWSESAVQRCPFSNKIHTMTECWSSHAAEICPEESHTSANGQINDKKKTAISCTRI